MKTVNVLFCGGFFDERMGEVTSENLQPGLVISVDTETAFGKQKYRLQDGPALQAAISGTSHPNLCARAIFEE